MAKDLANRVAQRAETAPAPTSDTDKTPAPRSIYSLIDAQRSEIARAAGPRAGPARSLLLRAVLEQERGVDRRRGPQA
jgi:hypothetical protein